jgi:hypothetical protein
VIEIKATTVTHKDDYHKTLNELPRHIRENTLPKPDEKGTTVTSTHHKLEEVQATFVDFWTAVFKRRIMEWCVDYFDPFPYMEGKAPEPDFPFETQWDEEMFNTLFANMKCYKAAGTNSIPGELLTQSPKKVKETWGVLFKNMWELNWIPAQWRESYIILLA